MKKNYINPQTEQIILKEAHNLLAGSPEDLGGGNELGDGTDLSRRRGGWFDDDE